MEKIDLIRDLHKQQTMENNNQPHNKGIKYQQYGISVQKHDITVLIPIRECERFEQTISKTSLLTKHKLKNILREHRGFIENKK